MPQSYPVLTPEVDPRSQGVIARQFKQKKKFVTHKRTLDTGQTDVIVEIVIPTQPPPAGRRPAGSGGPEGAGAGGKLGFRKNVSKIPCSL